MAKGLPIDKVRPLLKSQQDDARTRIQVGKIIQRIGEIHRGEIINDPQLLNTQLRAGEILLRKVLPDLSAIDMQAQVDGSLTITIKKEG